MIYHIYNIKMKYSWAQLSANIKSGKSGWLLFTRSVENNLKYDYFKEYLKSIRMTSSQYVKKLYLSHSASIILPNHYPYEVRKGISHYVFFSLFPLTKKEIEKAIKLKFKNKSVLWFINPEAIQSIPDLWHCQIFVKN